MESHADDDDNVIKNYKTKYNALIDLVKTLFLGKMHFSHQTKERNSTVPYMTQ